MRTGVEFEVSDEQRGRLEAIANDGHSRLKHARRARIILLADQDLGTMVIAAGIGASTAHIILARHRTAPHRWRHFKIPEDPEFEEKTRDITGPA